MMDFLTEHYNVLWLLVLAILGLSLIAQSQVKRVFTRYQKVPVASGKTGAQVARELLAANGSGASVQGSSGRLSDNYNPRTHTVSLSAEVADSCSVSAVAIAAHEVGHVLQYEAEYLPIKLRGAILPVAQIGSQAGPYLVIFSLFLGWNSIIALIGVGLYAFATLFQLVTLPVELNASRRALALLEDCGYISAEQSPGAKKMLSAAASTYVLAALASFVSLLRLMVLSRRRK